ncbi:MAG TPA: hypothetical protein VEB42_11735, partial [Chitinophagaceae bacterium]|nr:hypothetical protein [Chitinophagaceae bacterium]
VITDNNLILIGLSSATYAAMKTTENKVQTAPVTTATPPPAVTGTATNTGAPASTTITTATNVTTT